MVSNISFNGKGTTFTPAKKAAEDYAQKFVSDTELVADKAIDKVDSSKLNEAYKAIYTPFGAPTGAQETPKVVKAAAPEVFY